MRKAALLVISTLAIIAAVGLGLRIQLWSHHLILKTYFQDAEGMQAGTPVTIAGVPVGKVKSVRVLIRPGGATAEITLAISTSYALPIPSDSTVSVASAGLLGGTYLQIRTDGAKGPPATTWTVLKSQEPELGESTDLLKELARAANCAEQKASLAPPNQAEHKVKR